AIREVHVVVVAHEGVAAARDRPGRGLITIASRLGVVVLVVEHVSDRATERADAFDTSPKALAGRGRHAFLADAQPAMRALGIAEHDEERLHTECGGSVDLRGLDRRTI